MKIKVEGVLNIESLSYRGPLSKLTSNANVPFMMQIEENGSPDFVAVLLYMSIFIAIDCPHLQCAFES